MSKSEQEIGRAGEELAARALRNLGVEMVERIGTPVKLQPTKLPGAFRVIYGEKVSGDFRGVMPGGRSVLAEVKTIYDRNLRWSDLRDHQPGRLDEHTYRGGLTLLVWVHHSGIYVMEWPISGFGPHASIEPEWAMDIQKVKG